MNDLKKKILAEIENIHAVLKEMPDYQKLPSLSTLEIAGVAALLHSFYNGIENVLKQILKDKNIKVEKTESWHKDLVNLSVSKNIISKETSQNFQKYLAFRHYFSHAYAIELHSERLEDLVHNVQKTFNDFYEDISNYL
ncbi:MAG: hypothetical protein V1872_06235 [bacterium]